MSCTSGRDSTCKPQVAYSLLSFEEISVLHMTQDELIERLGGVDAVAEMSGRKRRMVKQPNGTYKYCLRSGEVALEKVLLAPPHRVTQSSD